MQTPIPERLTAWQNAMISDGRRNQTARDMAVMVTAVARTAGVPAEELTQIHCDVFSEIRSHVPSTRKKTRAYVARFQTWLVTGHATRSKAPITLAELEPFQTWLTEGRYQSNRRNGPRRMRPQSALAYANHIKAIAIHSRTHPTHVTEEQMEVWLHQHAGRKETYLNRALRAWRYYSQFAHIVDPTEDIPRYNAPTEDPHPRPAESECVAALLEDDDPVVVGMTILGAALGLRRAEICKVRGSDFFRVRGQWKLRVAGKGGKIRTMVVGARTMGRLACIFTPGMTGRFFPDIPEDMLKGGPVVGLILANAASRHGYVMTAHQLRHYAATTLFDQTKNLEAVRRLLGHSSMETTMRYVRAWTDEIAESSASAIDDVLDRITLVSVPAAPAPAGHVCTCGAESAA